MDLLGVTVLSLQSTRGSHFMFRPEEVETMDIVPMESEQPGQVLHDVTVIYFSMVFLQLHTYNFYGK